MIALPMDTNNFHSDSGQNVSYVVLILAEKNMTKSLNSDIFLSKSVSTHAFTLV